MFEGIETAARCIWFASLYNPVFGNACVSLYTDTTKSIPFCQTTALYVPGLFSLRFGILLRLAKNREADSNNPGIVPAPTRALNPRS